MVNQSYNSSAKGHLRQIINAIKDDDLNTFINVTRSANIFTTFDFETTEDTEENFKTQRNIFVENENP
ncbi:hypothetical protein Smp_122090 [Schistosoma mansoni]|uniref:hypothetical protein n=1 Tax=Schistosoma mansoni TaxID=6183 RepID=UPI0001A61A8B|nr:hypothetical protein Smp_122090 [Schistosoma mansoni]|eukprot:XP_018644912.1 hypothetical protein Smp_122090 [Schistosoma mansoni]